MRSIKRKVEVEARSSHRKTLVPLSRNIPLFIAFRVLFNARWYYPVLGVLFIDLGLTMEQYALPVAWYSRRSASACASRCRPALLAGQIGRKRMVVLAAACMVVEMLFFAFARADRRGSFRMLLVNRILSGAAESRCERGGRIARLRLAQPRKAGQGPARGARAMMRWQSAAFFVTMLLGALAYDPKTMEWIFGSSIFLSSATAIRMPLYLTLANAVLALVVALAMREPSLDCGASPDRLARQSARRLACGRWILTTPVVLFLILAGLCMDSVIRLFMTVGSNYYRLIALPEASYGVIGSAFGILGFFTPRISQWLVEHRSMVANFAATAALAFVGLLGAALLWPIWGVLAVIPIGVAMSMLQFFLSHYINQSVTDSSLRATVLSFKGLSINLSYGAIGLLFRGVHTHPGRTCFAGCRLHRGAALAALLLRDPDGRTGGRRMEAAPPKKPALTLAFPAIPIRESIGKKKRRETEASRRLKV